MLTRLSASQKASVSSSKPSSSLSSILLTGKFNSARQGYNTNSGKRNTYPLRALHPSSRPLIPPQELRIKDRIMFTRSKTSYAGMLPNGIPPSEYGVPLPDVPENWKTLAPFPVNANAQTYQQQESLPHLPIPTLPQTLNKLKSSLQAMAISYEEYEAAVAKIDEFGASGGPGEKLHSKLEKRREYEERKGGRGHWLEEWWDELGYMGYRDPVSRKPSVCVQKLNRTENIGFNLRVILLCVLFSILQEFLIESSKTDSTSRHPLKPPSLRI